MGRLVRPKKFPAARSLLTTRAITTPLAADFIYLRSNVRLFYGPESLTLKCANPLANGSRDSISNEVSVRNQLRLAKGLKVPLMVATNTGAESYILEQLLTDATPHEIAGDAGHFAASLMELYAANGLRPVSMSQAVDLTELLNSIARAAGLVGSNGASIVRQLQGVFSEIKADEVQLPYGLCHGDLALTNLMRDGDTTYLIDWERAGEGFIARDLGKLFDQLSELDQPMSGQIQAWQTACGGQWLDWRRQIALGGMANVTRRLEDFDRIEDGQSGQKKRALKSLRLSTNRLLRDMNAQT